MNKVEIFLTHDDFFQVRLSIIEAVFTLALFAFGFWYSIATGNMKYFISTVFVFSIGRIIGLVVSSIKGLYEKDYK